jgi:dienelactone hydrolase
MRTLLTLSIGAVCLLIAGDQAAAQGVGRLEAHPLESTTLTQPQFLTGQKAGKPAHIAGELRLPRGSAAKFPVVILVHGSGGINPATDQWARDLNDIGVAAFILDAFTGRGITSTVNDQTQLDSLAMTVDAYRALAMLAEHPRIDPKKIAIMGFSKGAVAAVYSSVTRFREVYGPANASFAAHIGFYTPCNVHYRGDDKVSGAPIRMFHGIADDYVSIEPCRTYVSRLKAAGADVSLTEYPDAYHAFDNFSYPPGLVSIPQGQTTRNCLIEERENGLAYNAKTGQPYSLNDACVEKGPHVAHNPAAYEASRTAVKQFLTARFELK